MMLMQKTVLKQGHDPPIAKGQPRNSIRNNAKAENLQFGEKQQIIIIIDGIKYTPSQ